MAEETTITAENAPKGANVGAQAMREDPRFAYPTVREFTGLVQVCVGAGAAFDIGDKRYFEGQVFRVGSKAYAEKIVAGGKFAHAPLGTPIGRLPAEPPPLPKPEPTDESEE